MAFQHLPKGVFQRVPGNDSFETESHRHVIEIAVLIQLLRRPHCSLLLTERGRSLLNGPKKIIINQNVRQQLSPARPDGPPSDRCRWAADCDAKACQ
ncbi:hypothetical protein GCM10010246_00170 [Streptomyces cuspidosporus]|uniref:Uncharacterized protein n=1 Tax=Streptomyces cuspidosporus TaxID=66882 RepID=A0ABP5S8U1_9ACTN